MTPADLRRFFQKVARGGYGCWEWTGTTNSTGYASFYLGSEMQCAHRLAYEYFVGPIPEGSEVDHLCFHKGCVNPDHLEVVSPLENTQRALRAGRRQGTDFCLLGHSRSFYGYRSSDGKLHCRACRRVQNQNAKRRKVEST